MEFFRNLPCWLWPLIAGIICTLLGYLLGRLSSGSPNYKEELEACKRYAKALKADLDACQAKISSDRSTPTVATSTTSMTSSFIKKESMDTSTTSETTTDKAPPKTSNVIPIAFDALAAKAAFGKKIKENDLTVVEGIGPKISELFHNHDIKTWAALASTSVEKCQEVLNSGGKRFEIHRPGTWPMQAEMAALGKWAELKKWQSEHKYGKA